MSKKRVSYQNLLKTAIAEFDTSKTVDVKGPMLDPILKWDGQGEVPIYKDAASILERYYFNESYDKGVEVSEMEYNEDGTEAKTDAMKDAEGTGTEQAGTSDKATIPAAKKEIEKDLAKEGKTSKGKAVSEKEFNGKSAVKPKKYVDEQDEDMEDDASEEEADEEMTESLENAVIEKLIAEMEEEDEEDEDKEEVEESDVMGYTGDGVKPGMEAPDEKKASGPEEDTQGAGTEQAGTGTDAGQIPDRKDNADKMVKPKNYNEQEDASEEEDEEELDVDTEIKEDAGVGAGPIPPMKAKAKNDNKEGDEADAYEEAFQIFKEAIEDEDEEDEKEEKEEE